MLHDKIKMFYKIINLIKLHYKLKNKILKTKLYKSDFIILNILLKLNIIKNIKKAENNYYYISLNDNSNYNNITNLYKPSKIKTINLKTIKKINRKKTNIFYISTNYGVINNFEAEKKKIGGILIMSVQIQ